MSIARRRSVFRLVDGLRNFEKNKIQIRLRDLTDADGLLLGRQQVEVVGVVQAAADRVVDVVEATTADVVNASAALVHQISVNH